MINLSTLILSAVMIIEMPVLPYSSESLAPAISKSTIEYHYGKHLQTYVNNLNTLIEGTSFAQQTVEEIVKNAKEGPMFNNAGQVLNHSLYFLQFKPYPKARLSETEPITSYQSVMKYNPPTAKVASRIEADFGTIQNFMQAMEDAAVKLFGSGWAWLVVNEEGKLQILQYANADNPVRHNLKPVLCFDVWEHAYYIDFQNRRAEHIGQIWNIIDWKVVEIRLGD